LYLNTGWSSALNRYNRRLLTQEADLVTTHEFGHNWGSEHDPDTSECSPSSFKDGKYIMYTYSVSGYDTNNKLFSPCSQRSMGAVLRAKSNKCFSEARKAYCGNSRVEPGEECDVGPEGQKDMDNCCDQDCKLRQNAKCSDMNHDCCHDCQYAHTTRLCREQSSCDMEAFCNGLSENCPESQSKLDDEPCLERGKCRDGVCLAYCETVGKVSCICDNVTTSCQWCCKSSHNATCDPHYDDVGRYLNLPDGMPCIQGYCANGICEKQVQDLVERFWNIIENITASQLVAFMRANIVGTVIILSLLIWIPVSCVVSYKDRQRREEETESQEWLRYDNPYLLRAQDSEKVKTVNRVHRRSTRERQAMFSQRVGATEA
jgi:disintegrin and metalloproteinase domain-containing protein 17